MKELSNRSADFTDSVIRRMTRVANKYGAVNLSQGFPDFDPPEEITDRLAEVAKEGPHQYALTWGAKNFRDAIADKYEHFSGLKVDPESEIVVTCGSTEAMMATMLSITNPGDKVVYLTFDDGPGPYTEKLLDILDRYNVKATFFVTNGKPDYQNLIAQEAQRGHTVAIHSASHDYAKIYQSVDAYFADFDEMNSIITAQTGKAADLVRFPGGSSNTISKKYCYGIMSQLVCAVEERGFRYCDWNVSSGDAGGTTSTSQVVANVIEGIKSNNVSVVLQHDIKNFSVDAVEQIIQWGLSEGYTFLPMTSTTPMSHHGVNN